MKRVTLISLLVWALLPVGFSPAGSRDLLPSPQLAQAAAAEPVLLAAQAEGDAQEVLARVQARAIDPPEQALKEFATRKERNDPDRLRAILLSFDKYADYKSSAEFQQLMAVRDMYTYGVGMDILQDEDGSIVCKPYPGHAAEQAGIVEDDILVRVDAFSLRGIDLAVAAVLIAGEEPTPLDLTVLRNGEELKISCTRQSLSPPTLSTEVKGKLVIVRIWRFTRHLAAELRHSLDAVQPLLQNGSHKLVFDLRGNSGGDLDAMRETVQLFLPQGAIVYSSLSRQGTTVYTAKENGPFQNVRPLIWQDRFSASSSEAFCLALKQNERAIVLGESSAGKACAQESGRLPGGGLLRFTTETLRGPLGTDWEGQGIAPDLQAVGFEELMQKSEALKSPSSI